MDIQDLEAKRSELETSFNKTKEQIDSLTTELYRLQGEYRAVNALIESYESPSVKVENEPAEEQK